MMPLGMRGVPTPGRLSRKGREGVPGMAPRVLAAMAAAPPMAVFGVLM